MAKNNNLTDFLTDVANAIRDKEGSTEAINPQDFSDRILALKGAEEDYKDICFLDYDGTILHSYYLRDLKDADGNYYLTIPPYPEHEGLNCQCWTDYYDNAPGDRVQVYGGAMHGALFVTNDGVTKIHLRFKEETVYTLQWNASTYYRQTCTFDWGDGTSEICEGQSGTKTHTYAAGEYVLRVLDIADSQLGITGGTSAVTLVTLGNDIASYSGGEIKAITIPRRTMTVNLSGFLGRHVSACEDVTITIPASILDSVIIGSSNSKYTTTVRASITKSNYNSEESYRKVFFKGTNIIYGAFSKCYGLELLDLTRSQSVVSLGSTTIFPSAPSIVVPDHLYESYISATNWSTFANYIVKASKYYG